MNEKIKQILQLAIHAPSGENSQPWRFEMRNNQIDLYNIPSRDTSLYNWGQRASYVAHGALIENISTAAPVLGYTPHITTFPNSADPEHTARITLQESQPTTNPLYPYIKERTTNRKPYKKISLTEEQREEFFRLSERIDRGKILFLEKDQDKKTVARAVAANERILFENPYMHKFFYDHITWTEQEDQEKKIGFYIKTFELPPPAEAIFKLAKNQAFVRIANGLGFSKMIVEQNAKIYVSASAFGAIIMPGNSPEDFLVAGRILQRVWLIATKLGLSTQPLTGTLFLTQRIFEEQTDKLTPHQKEFIKQQYEHIRQIFGLKDETIAMLFRLGDGEKPTARSLRLEPQIEVLS